MEIVRIYLYDMLLKRPISVSPGGNVNQTFFLARECHEILQTAICLWRIENWHSRLFVELQIRVETCRRRTEIPHWSSKLLRIAIQHTNMADGFFFGKPSACGDSRYTWSNRKSLGKWSYFFYPLSAEETSVSLPSLFFLYYHRILI